METVCTNNYMSSKEDNNYYNCTYSHQSEIVHTTNDNTDKNYYNFTEKINNPYLVPVNNTKSNAPITDMDFITNI